MSTEIHDSQPITVSSKMPQAHPDGSASLARGFRSLRNRNYRLYWSGQVISLTGSWMQTTAQAWLVLQITGSPLSLGLVTTLQFLPVTFLALYGGVLADRLRKRSALLVTQSAALLQALAFGILVATGAIQLWHIYLLAIIQGIISAIDNPTRQAFVVEMVEREDLVNAVALNSMSFNAARILGPFVAGVLIGQIGVAPALMLNAISFLFVIAALLRMDPSALHVVPLSTQGSVSKRLVEGLSYTRHTPQVLAIFMVVAAIGTFGFNFSIILPLLARFVLHTTATGFGSLASFMGIGSLGAAITTAYIRQVTMRRLILGAGAFSVLLGAVALTPVFALSAVLLIALGFAGITFATSSNTLLQLSVPDALRGRVMSLHVLLFMGSTPLGGFLIGALSDTIGVAAALLVCAVMCLVGVIGAVIYYRMSPHPVLPTR